MITYTPSNQARDGKYRKIKVDLVDPSNNQPMRMEDDKHKPLKYTIYAKAGYTAPKRGRLTGSRGIDKHPASQSQELNLAAFEFLTKCLTYRLQTCYFRVFILKHAR